MKILLSTTGSASEIILHDLYGKVFTHPVGSEDLLLEFSLFDIRRSNDLQVALDTGSITLKDEYGVDFSDLMEDLAPSRNIAIDMSDLGPGRYLKYNATSESIGFSEEEPKGATGVCGQTGLSGPRGSTGLLGHMGATGIGVSGTTDVFFPAPKNTARYGLYQTLRLNHHSSGWLFFRVPMEARCISNVYVSLIPERDVEDGRIDLTSQYASCGNFYDENGASKTIYVTMKEDRLAEIEVTDLFAGVSISPWELCPIRKGSGLGAGDYAALRWRNRGIGSRIYILGIRLVYSRT